MAVLELFQKDLIIEIALARIAADTNDSACVVCIFHRRVHAPGRRTRWCSGPGAWKTNRANELYRLRFFAVVPGACL